MGYTEVANVADMANVADPLGDEFHDRMLAELKDRVSPKRLKHILGVSDTAAMLARVYGCDERKARLAGLLHDWDKGLDDDQIRQRVRELGIEDQVGPWVVENMPQVLHGPTASVALAREHPDIPDDVIQAIYRHTTGALGMSDLDKVIYVADAIEPGRNFDGLEGLQDDVGRVTLDELFFEVYKFWTLALVRNDRVLHPDTIPVWNEYAASRPKPGKHGKRKRKGGRND